jgi:molybdate/tungstate transport system ATP-binding protein
MIELLRVSMSQGAFSLSDIDMEIPAGKYGVLMGKSGCGKTTLLEAVCGLRPVSGGRIVLAGRDVTKLAPRERGVGYVPQDLALFPTLTVRDQLAFSLVVRKDSPAQIGVRVAELAELLELEGLLDRKPNSLSGGEAQRVALGRALASRPSVLCLDEPLSALDEELHGDMCKLLAGIHQHEEVTIFHITHSPSEARRLGEIRFRLSDGILAQE